MMSQVVAAVSHQGRIYIFTSNGDVWQMWLHEHDGMPQFRKLTQLNL